MILKSSSFNINSAKKTVTQYVYYIEIIQYSTSGNNFNSQNLKFYLLLHIMLILHIHHACVKNAVDPCNNSLNYIVQGQECYQVLHGGINDCISQSSKLLNGSFTIRILANTVSNLVHS